MKNKIDLLLKANQARIEQRYQDAISHYLSFLESHSIAKVMWILSLTYFQLYLEQPETEFGQQSIFWLDKAIELEPNRPEFYASRGDILSYGVDVPNYEEAAKNYRTALKLNPSLVTALFGVASLDGVPDKVIRLSEAIVAMEDATKLQPENPLGYLRLGTLYQKAGQIHKAQESFEQALSCPKPLSESHIKVILQKNS